MTHVQRYLMAFCLVIGSAHSGQAWSLEGTQAETGPGPSAVAAEPAREPLLQPYDPITGGYTKESNDVPFMDVTLSLKYRLLPTQLTGNRQRAFLSLTTRFGFYWGTRDNSPVVAKSYNPKLIWRYLPNGTADIGGSGDGGAGNEGRNEHLQEEYAQFVDFAYAHESNGQLIHTQAQYVATQAALQQPKFVNDEIHRGWDYLEVAWKKSALQQADRALSSQLDLKYFMPVGLLQGAADEYHSWENNRQGKPRKSVDGITESLRYQWYGIGKPVDDTKLFSRSDVTLKLTTGYHDPFKFATVRAELGFQTYVLPVTLWVQSGYMSALAMYYEKVNAFGLELRVRSF